jgi:hypothetical protein
MDNQGAVVKKHRGGSCDSGTCNHDEHQDNQKRSGNGPIDANFEEKK